MIRGYRRRPCFLAVFYQANNYRGFVRLKQALYLLGLKVVLHPFLLSPNIWQILGDLFQGHNHENMG